jgi:hypothetical protein
MPIQVLALSIMVGLLALPVSGTAYCDRGWPRNVAYGIIGVMLVMIGLVLVGTISRVRDGTGIPPKLPSETTSLSSQLSELTGLDEKEAKQRFVEILEKSAAEKKRRDQQIRDWYNAMANSWEIKVFGAYTTVCILAQFAVIGLQTARVRL